MADLAGGGWGDIPSNDPGERRGEPKAPGVNSEGFDPKYEATVAPDGSQPSPRVGKAKSFNPAKLG